MGSFGKRKAGGWWGSRCDFCDGASVGWVKLVQPCGLVFRACLSCAAKVDPERAARKAGGAASAINVTRRSAGPGGNVM